MRSGDRQPKGYPRAPRQVRWQKSAFSALRLDSYRHFLRLKIEGDKLTIYPIGIDKSPQRDHWKHNPEYGDPNAGQDTPAITPSEGLGQDFIEGPLIIDAGELAPLKAG